MDGSFEMNGVRIMNADDLAECLARCESTFRLTWPLMDGPGMLSACVANIGNPTVLMVRTKNAFGVATAETSIFEPRIWVKEQWVFSDSKAGESLRIYHTMMDWGRAIGAFRFTFGSLTSYNLDVFANRLGHHAIHNTYTYSLE